MDTPQTMPSGPCGSAPSLLGRVASSLGWLGLQKVFVIVLGVAVTGLVARQLGPEQTGLLGGAQALAVLFGVASMGVDTTVFIRRLRHCPEQEHALLGSTAAVLAVSGISSWLLLAAYLMWVDGGPVELRITAAIVGLRLWLTFPAPVAMWFQARLATREVVVANTAGTLAFRGWQLLSGCLGWGILRLAWADLLSYLTVSWFTLRAYLRKGGSMRAWRVDWRLGWSVLAESLPALVSVSLVTFMSRIDVIMLRAMRGETEIGYFTAATSITESLTFISGMLAAVFGPVLAHSVHEDPEAYSRQGAAYMRLAACLGWCMALGVCVASPLITAVVFGPAYSATAPVLAVHAFLLVPAMLGAAAQCQLTLERRLPWFMLILLVALGLGVTLNAWLIPPLGACGAALASVLASAAAHVVASALLPQTRRVGLLALRSMLLPFPRRADLAAFAGPLR